MKDSTHPAVYVQTNEADGNRVLAFRREADGSLSELGAYATGGVGDGKPHLTSQGSVVLTGDGSHLLVTNAGSGDLSVFEGDSDGPHCSRRSPPAPRRKASPSTRASSMCSIPDPPRSSVFDSTACSGSATASWPRAPIRPRSASRPTAPAS